jgi:hypothetical protein
VALALGGCGSGVAVTRDAGTGGSTGQLCTFQPDGALLKNCSKHLVNDCETNVLADVDNCGDCDVHCPRPPNVVDDDGNVIATAWCDNGACALACASNHADCNGVVSDGCEVGLADDPTNCGACGHRCGGSDARGEATCTGGVCGLVCDVGFADCNWVEDDGCEVSLSSDVKNCGACANACSSAGGTASCDDGICRISCSAGHADCNVDASDGCEADLATDAKNCGQCGVMCDGGTCSAGACQ